MATTFLIFHALIAVALIGGLTHQTMAACWPATRRDSFFSSYRAVSAASYTTVNIALYLIVATLGGILYPVYRLAVSNYLVAARLWTINGSFELKEQFVAVGLGMLPLYWLVWRRPLDEKLRGARIGVTGVLCFVVWYSFIIGHVLNNVRGLFGR